LKVAKELQPDGSKDRYFRVLEFAPDADSFMDLGKEDRKGFRDKKFRIGQELDSDPGNTVDATIFDAQDKHHQLRFGKSDEDGEKGAYVTSLTEMKKKE